MTTPTGCASDHYESCTCFQTTIINQPAYTSCNACLNANKGYYWINNICVSHQRQALPEYMTCFECLINGYDWGMECMNGSAPSTQISSCKCNTSSPTLTGYNCVYTSDNGEYNSGEACLKSGKSCYVYCSKNKINTGCV
jgi:hypothetical protein